MENPYLKELEANVIEKRYSNNKYYIKLDRTIFYPHMSGGQPGDKGNINGVEVLEAYEDGDDIVHVLENGVNSNRVNISIDWENRLDLMQQHTGQHLLSAVFYKLFNGETVGFNISKEYVYVDITIPSLSEEDAEKVEMLANKVIYSNFNIKSYFVSENQLQKLPIRKAPKVQSNIRIVEIDNFDFCPCGGTHLSHTGELGIVKIRKWEKYKGNVRVEFICGMRALKDYTWKNLYIKEIGSLLSSKDKDILNKVNKLYHDKEDLEKENRVLRDNLLKLKGDSFLKDANIKNNIKFIYKELENMDIKELSYIANYLQNSDKLIQIYGLKINDKSQFYVSGSRDININLQEILKKISSQYNIKGGGNPNTVQGNSMTSDLKNIMENFANYIIKEIKVR